MAETELKRLRADLERYFVLDPGAGPRRRLRVVLTTVGIWYIVSYRLGRWARRDLRVPGVRFALRAFTALVHFGLTVLLGIEISFDTEIGPGFYIGHCGYIVINPAVRLGSNCNVSVGVVIGEGGRGGRRGSPVIGDNAYIGPGAKVFGPITLGNHVAVGANAVVNASAPDRAVLAGNPATVVSYAGSADFVIVEEAH